MIGPLHLTSLPVRYRRQFGAGIGVPRKKKGRLSAKKKIQSCFNLFAGLDETIGLSDESDYGQKY